MILKSGEYLFMEGDKNNTLFIVQSGELEGISSKHPRTRTYGPGTLIGEYSLLEGAPCKETIRAVTDCEMQVINQAGLQEALSKEPGWLKSILTFLSGRTHIAKANLKKSNKVKALPSLLYLLSNRDNVTSLHEIFKEIRQLFNIADDETLSLLKALQDLDVLKLQGEEIRVESPRVIALLYNTICYRALHKKVSPNILPLTDQTVLSAVTRAVQESRAPLDNGRFVVTTENLKAVAKKTFHQTITLRTVQSLVQRGLLIPSTPHALLSPTAALESIQSFSGDFDKVLDILELNRIFPLLDKNLVS